MEKFSVLIPVYYKDNPLFFERALTSITVDQTLMPDEILIIEDLSLIHISEPTRPY